MTVATRKSGLGLDLARLVRELVPLSQAAVLDDAAATRLIRRYGRSIGAEWSVILAHPFDGGPPRFAASHGMPEAARQAYDGHFHRLEPWPAWSRRAGVPFGQPALSQDMASVAEFRRLAYYQDFWRPQADLLHTAGSLFAIDSKCYGHVAFPRSRSFGPYPEITRTLIAQINPHLGAMLATRLRLERTAVGTALARHALAQLDLPAFALTGDGRLTVLNPAAETWLAGQSALRIVAGRWRCADAAVHARLAPVLDPRGRGPAVPVARTVDLAGETCRIERLAVDAQGAGTQGGDRSSWLVLVQPLTETSRRQAEALAHHHGLTPAERHCCMLLLQGLGLAAIARHREVGLETVRSQARHVYAKLGVRGQRGLLAAAARSVPALSGPSR